VATTTESKSVSVGLCRFETYRATLFFYRNTPSSDIDSWMVSSELHLTGLSRVVTTTESKSVSLEVGSKPAAIIFAVYKSSEIHFTRLSHWAKTSFLRDTSLPTTWNSLSCPKRVISETYNIFPRCGRTCQPRFSTDSHRLTKPVRIYHQIKMLMGPEDRRTQAKDSVNLTVISFSRWIFQIPMRPMMT